MPTRLPRARPGRALLPLVLGVALFVGLGFLTAAPRQPLMPEAAAVRGAVHAASTIAGTNGSAELAPQPAMPITVIPEAANAEPGGGPPLGSLIGYRWPLAHPRLTLPYGPTPWGSRVVDGQPFHDGIDLATFCGDRVVAAHDGVVLAAGRRYDDVMGWVGDLTPYYRRLDAKHLWPTLPIVVVVDDGNGYRSVYAHFSEVFVTAGDTVGAGELLGHEGMTGRASGCHLHYGLFSPYERSEFAIDRGVVRRMKVPPAEIARVDPILVLPARPTSHPPAEPATPTSP